MAKCVLICDDNPAIAQSLTGYFQEEGIRVVTAATGAEAFACIEKEKPDAMILDVMLPDMNGRDICLEIRQTSELPILMLSAKGEEIDRIIGLQIGADDYVTKPFSPHEVLLRTKRLMRRSGDMAQKKYTVAELTLLPESFEAYIREERIRLSAKEFKILCYLADHAGKVVTREHIINAVWGIEYAGELRMVDTVITRLRHKLFQEERQPLHFDITTVFGVGYKIEEIP
ncbi:MAG: response regulator transcription factor [Oscillospiraceae bacterium]|nr:response regulator transcription factor [Oscillospiraceae bacterium]